MARFLKEGKLQSTIKLWASTPCSAYPCGLEVWRYACLVSGIEPPELPEHQSRREMLELLKEKGGLEQYARELMLSLGWSEVGSPARGDVGVVDFQGMGVTCAISLGIKWMAKGPGNVLTVSAPHRAIWRFQGCRRQ